MTPFWEDDWLQVWQGDCRAVMAGLPAESVHCVVTSPPYWGLRDYGDASQLGLEPTPEEYVANMVDVFREVRRVLRSDGTVWLNLGDSYLGGGGFSPDAPSNRAGAKQTTMRGATGARGLPVTGWGKAKDLAGIPWRVALALQQPWLRCPECGTEGHASAWGSFEGWLICPGPTCEVAREDVEIVEPGWYLRSDIIWSKPNPMPESVTDRPTKSHEYLFLLSKSPRYYFDADAVRESNSPTSHPGFAPVKKLRDASRGDADRAISHDPRDELGRNLRSVWTIATQPYPGAHFATFPRKLVEPCIKAGTSERGVCPECGAPWRRVTETETKQASPVVPLTAKAKARAEGNGEYRPNNTETGGVGTVSTVRTLTWIRSCTHDLPPVPATVLDCFAGSGTTALVAQSLGRRAILIDLSTDYLKQIMDRNAQMPLGVA